MGENVKKFSSWAARRYFGVARPSSDENGTTQQADVIVGAQNMGIAEPPEPPAESQVQLYSFPPVLQLTPSSQPLFSPPKAFWNSVRWEQIHPVYETGNEIVQPRHGHKAIAFKNLMIVFSGGNEAIFQEMNIYSTATNKWYKPRLRGVVPPGKASYGAAIDGHRLLIYGGMEEERRISDTLYECNLQTWEWNLLQPCGRTRKEKPEGRNGFSFTGINDMVFMFGGCVQVKDKTRRTFESFSNDLHVLYPRLNKQHGLWIKPKTFGNQPLPRESHAAVGYVSKDSEDVKLVIFGGRCEFRMGDCHSLDVNTMMWTKIEVSFTPRSLHSATLVGDRAYIFGGWSPRNEGENRSGGDPKDDVCDQLMCFNLTIMDWEIVLHTHVTCENWEPKLSPSPPPRAGHSAVAIDDKIYLWSGRQGFEREDHGRPICLDDFWILEVTQLPIYEFGQVPLAYVVAEDDNFERGKSTENVTALPEVDGQLTYGLSRKKNEGFSLEPPAHVSNQVTQPQASISPSPSDIAEFIHALEVAQQMEQQSQGDPESQELRTASEMDQFNRIPEQTEAIFANVSTSMVPTSAEFYIQTITPSFEVEIDTSYDSD